MTMCASKDLPHTRDLCPAYDAQDCSHNDEECSHQLQQWNTVMSPPSGPSRAQQKPATGAKVSCMLAEALIMGMASTQPAMARLAQGLPTIRPPAAPAGKHLVDLLRHIEPASYSK